MSRFSFRGFSLLILAAALGCGGCASTYKVTVAADSRAAGIPPGHASFQIRNHNAASLGALRQGEVANYLKAALSAHGLYEAPTANAADMLVEIDYGIAPPRVEVIAEQEMLFGRPVSVSDHIGAEPQGVMREVMGYSKEVTTKVVREKYMSICARENRSRADEMPPADLWRVHVSIENESDDLRGHLPVLISAAMDHMGQNTGGEEELTLHSDDEAIRFVRRGM